MAQAGMKTYEGVYLILSLKWSDTDSKLVWWGSDNCGYTADIDKAGHYTAEQVAEKAHYYDNDDTTRAVPVEDVFGGKIGPIRRIIDATFRYPTRDYDCHHCDAEVTRRRDPRLPPITCYNCGKEICAVCADVEECSVGSATEEVGA